MFNSLGWPEIAVLVIIALFIFGPDRLPSAITEGRRMLQTLRKLANNARDDFTAELGPEFQDLDLSDLNPKTFVAKHLWDDESDGDRSTAPKVDAGATEIDYGSSPLEAGERPPYDSDAT